MITKFRFTLQASKEFFKLEPKIQKRILVKLDYYCSSENPTLFARRLTDVKIGQYRFRIGDYRVICDLDEEGFRVLKVGHRKEVYK